MTWMAPIAGAAAVVSAVAGCVYANFSARVMPRLAELPAPQGIATMQVFNSTALRAPFMTVFFGSATLSVAVLALLFGSERHGGAILSGAGALLCLAGFTLTVAYNVPRNEALAAVSSLSPEAVPLWNAYLREWTAANSVRAMLSLLGAAALGAGALASLAR